MENTTTEFPEQLKQLEEKGFHNRKQNLRLLRKANGNLEIVTNLLVAKEAMKESSRVAKEDNKVNKKRSHDQHEPEEEDSKQSKKRLKEEEKNQKWAIKEAKKLAKKEAAKNRRQQKQKEKFHKKEQREQEKLIKKQTKFIERQKRPPFKLPDGISRAAIDGNNILLVLPSVRNKDPKIAVQILGQFVNKWMKLSALQECVLFFENGISSVEGRLMVAIAQPQFSTTGDAIVNWAQKLPTDHRGKWIVFSDNRGLTHQLADMNLCVGTANQFFEVAIKELSNTNSTNDEEQKDHMVEADELFLKQLSAISL